MGVLTIRIGDEVRDELEHLATIRGRTLSDLVREQIDVLLGRDVDLPQDLADAPSSLSLQQRELLALLHEVLQELSNNSAAEYHKNMVEILREGYAAEYARVFGETEEELSRADCRLLWDVLDMFRALHQSVDRLSDEERRSLGAAERRYLRFGGFDLNDPGEARLLRYLRFLIQTDRWTDFETYLEEIGDGGNSHRRSLPSYERMLSAYKRIVSNRRSARRFAPEGFLLDGEELRRVAEAWATPG